MELCRENLHFVLSVEVHAPCFRLIGGHIHSPFPIPRTSLAHYHLDNDFVREFGYVGLCFAGASIEFFRYPPDYETSGQFSSKQFLALRHFEYAKAWY